VKYEDVVVDLRRSAELIYRFVGVDSVPNDTRAWIEQNYAAASQSINQPQLHSTDSNVSRVPPVKTGAPVRYTPPSEERSTRRVESRYLSPSEEWKKRKSAPAEDNALTSRYFLSSSGKMRRTRLVSADDSALKSTCMSSF